MPKVRLSKVFKYFLIVAILMVAPAFLVYAQSSDAPPGNGALPPERPPAQASSTPAEIPPVSSTATSTAAQAPAASPAVVPQTPKPSTSTTTKAPTAATTTVVNNLPKSPPVALYTSPSSADESSIPLPAIVGLVFLAPLGVYGILKVIKGNSKQKNIDRCAPIKNQLEQKKSELNLAQSKFSIQDGLTRALKEKMEKQKDEIQDKIKDKAIEKIKNKVKLESNSTLGRAVGMGESASETYSDLSEKYEQAQKIKEALQAGFKTLAQEVESLEKAYSACMSGLPVAAAMSEGGLEIELPDTGGDIEWIFFDVAGVLTDESRFTNWIQENATQVIKKYIPDITLEKVRQAGPVAGRRSGNLNENMLRLFLEGAQLEEALKEWKEIRAGGLSHTEQQEINPDALEVVKALSEKYKLGIMANQHKETKAKLEKAGILEYFKLKEVSEDYGLSKPDPEFFKKVLENAGIEPANSALIDDNFERAIIPAKRLGMTTVWFKLEERKVPTGVADFTVTSLRDLLKIF